MIERAIIKGKFGMGVIYPAQIPAYKAMTPAELAEEIARTPYKLVSYTTNGKDWKDA